MFYHISPSASFLGVLKMFAKRNKKRKNKVIFLEDNLAFGFLGNIFDDKILQKRADFLAKNMFFIQKFIYGEDFENSKKIGYFEDLESNFYVKIHKNFRENLQKIEKNDKIFIYLEHNLQNYLFLSYFLNIYSEKNFKVHFLPKNSKITCKNGEKMKPNLGIFNPDEIGEIFRKGENLTEKEEKFFKNLLFEIPENNILRILKNKKIVEINDDFLEEKIFKIIKKEKKIISILGDFLAKYHKKDFGNEFVFSYIFEKLINSQKIILEEKSKKWEYKNKKMEKKYFIIKKVLGI